jgi:thioredoxin 1
MIMKFYADWCQPCKLYSPYVYEVFPDVIAVDIDSEEGRRLSKLHAVRGIPTLVMVDDKTGEEVRKLVGQKSVRELKEFKEKGEGKIE